MDEKEQADRMAAAEALYMISTRVDKSGPVPKMSKRGRREKGFENYSDKLSSRRDNSESASTAPVSGRGKRGARGGRGRGAGRGGRGKRGGGSSPRGGKEGSKSAGSGRSSRGKVFVYNSEDVDAQNHNKFSTRGNTISYLTKQISSDEDDEPVPHQYKGSSSKTKSQVKVKGSKQHPSTRRSSTSQNASNSNSRFDDGDVGQVPHQAIGFTGAAISIPKSPIRSYSQESSQNLPSLGLVSGLRQVSLTTPSYAPTSLGSVNLTSLPTEVNLPSLPVEIGSLQLSSQPTPNLSSLDLPDGMMEDDVPAPEREKSEKFLPLKKRKLLSSNNDQLGAPVSSLAPSPPSDPEERYESLSPPSSAEPVKAFTVQASPIITMQTLMEIKTALNADDDGDLPLHIAVVHENMRMVIKLINLMKIAGKGVDKFNKQQQTPLHLAVKLNFLEAINILIDFGADVNAVDCTGSSSIHMAVQGKSIECLAMLLNKCPHVDLNARNFDGLTPLHMAVDNGNLEQVEMLLNRQADIDVTDGKSGRTSLFRAAESNQKAMVELLLRKGANPDIPNYAGVTTAMAAQGRNLHGVLKLLGSIPNDKFTEFDTKPLSLSMETKPMYSGFSVEDRSGGVVSMSRRASQELTNSSTESRMGSEKSDLSNNETKVFHNVFVVSQNQSKKIGAAYRSHSASEPASPQVKLEVMEEEEASPQEGTRLMSLPEELLSRKEEDMEVDEGDRGRKPGWLYRVASYSGASADTKPMLSKLHVASPAFQSRSAGATPTPGSVPNNRKPVTVHIIPPTPPILSPTSTAGLIKVVPSKSTAPTESSHPSHQATPASSPSSSSDSITLTGIQARLYQKLLEMYNIDPGTPASSSGRPKSPPSFSTSAATASVGDSRAGQVNQLTRSTSHPGNIALRIPSVKTPSPSVGRGAPFYRLGQTVWPSQDQDKMEEGPLNLSKSSSRQVDRSDMGSTSVNPRKPDTPGVAGSQVDGSDPPGNQRQGTSLPLGQKGKVISIGVRRISTESERPGQVNSPASNQYEMFLLPAASSGPVTSAANTGMSLINLPASSRTSAGRLSSSLTNPRSGEMITSPSDFPRVTKLTSHTTTAPFVREFSSQQNVRHQHHISQSLSSSSPPSSLTSPTTSSTTSSSSMLKGVPTVLDMAVDVHGSAAGKHIVTLTRSPSNIVTINRASPGVRGPPMSSLQPPNSTDSPIFLHQGQVIDLSRSSGRTDTSQNHVSTTVTTANPGVVSPAAVEGKIVGLSGAILSVIPSSPDKVAVVAPVLERNTAPAKEPQKKRGRKSQKSNSNTAVSADQGLNKINSETDEKLKKFLGAKKHENAMSGQLSGGDKTVSDVESKGSDPDRDRGKVRSESITPSQEKDTVYKTVGIFSGDVQHVKIGKRFPALAAGLTSHLDLSSSPTSLVVSSPASPLVTGGQPSSSVVSGVTSSNITTLTVPGYTTSHAVANAQVPPPSCTNNSLSSPASNIQVVTATATSTTLSGKAASSTLETSRSHSGSKTSTSQSPVQGGLMDSGQTKDRVVTVLRKKGGKRGKVLLRKGEDLAKDSKSESKLSVDLSEDRNFVKSEQEFSDGVLSSVKLKGSGRRTKTNGHQQKKSNVSCSESAERTVRSPAGKDVDTTKSSLQHVTDDRKNATEERTEETMDQQNEQTSGQAKAGQTTSGQLDNKHDNVQPAVTKTVTTLDIRYKNSAGDSLMDVRDNDDDDDDDEQPALVIEESV